MGLSLPSRQKISHEPNKTESRGVASNICCIFVAIFVLFMNTRQNLLQTYSFYFVQPSIFLKHWRTFIEKSLQFHIFSEFKHKKYAYNHIQRDVCRLKKEEASLTRGLIYPTYNISIN